MTAVDNHYLRHHVAPQREVALRNPVFQAFLLLRIGFTVAPIAFGLDKFFDVLVDWDTYLAPRIDRLVPGNAHQAMLAAVKRGDTVVLSSGMIGKIVRVEDKEVGVEVATGVTVKVVKTMIAEVRSRGSCSRTLRPTQM